MISSGNIFAALPPKLADEQSVELLSCPTLRIERIVSTGQVTPPGQWYDQENAEWVVLIQGAAQVLFDGEGEPRMLKPGDYMHIPAHVRHRVTWTDPSSATVWLAVHYR